MKAIASTAFLHIKSPYLAEEHPRERLARIALGAVLALLVMAYLYFVTASVLNIMARKEALRQMDTIQATIGTMESQYFALSQSLTPESGAKLGLAPIAKTTYVYQPGNAALAATIAHNEI